ncbi:ATP-binding cassette domain-containing protein [Alkalibaculum sp. M08DMB]|uniref:ATP-binding cassette domain-containing protein n=1 Tax=Alkalibaculum sporogenes TaxID=2655001 RepID=A0A6A7KD48_9FIRM|nr:ATP-binding cassette domain-containing protein [Alkalibaculum sporogenes]
MNLEVLKTENLVVSYGDKRVLDCLNISIYKGEFVGIIGPNGTGKSTLVKAITNIIDSHSGDIFIEGRENRNISKKERAKLVAVVPQEFSIDYEFTNLDIVMMGRNPHIDKKNKIGQKDFDIVKEAMTLTNTWDFKDRFFNELSGGERQRVIVARAIAQQTHIILLDEPTSHLDIHHQLEVMELIHLLKKKRNITVVAVLHDINMAARFSDRLILINHGKVVADGTPEEVIKEEHLSKLYSMEMIVRENKILGKREIIPLRAIKELTEKKGINIHVVCGGGTGEKILERLKSLGFNVTAGIINEGDSDWEICKILKIPCVVAPPFSGYSNEDADKNRILINQSDYVLVTSVPFGIGNLLNLEVLRNIEKPIYFYQNSKIDIDYAQGKAIKLLDELQKKENFNYIQNYDELLQKL